MGGKRRGWKRRGLWLSLHKWFGLLLCLAIIPLSATGSLLVWHDWTDGLANPQRYRVSESRAGLPPSVYLDSARRVLVPDDRIASIDLPPGAGSPVTVLASRPADPGRARPGPPPRTEVWLDPADGRIVDVADPATGILRTLHVLHGTLMIPEVGRKIVGWIGWAMLVSCLTGLWLWLPASGRALRGFRWRRGPLFSGNLHHRVGIWIAAPLAVLSLTGAWISFPDFFGGVERAIAAQPAEKSGSPRPDRRARPLAATRLGVDEVAARASGQGGRLVSLRWLSEGSRAWAASIERGGEVVRVEIDDISGAVRPAPDRGGAARFMRQLHDAHEYNPVWQTVAFLAGLAPAVLGITGVIMWLRTRGWRKRVHDRRARRREREAGGGKLGEFGDALPDRA